MEIQLIDFKQSLEAHIGKIDKNQDPKAKDFNNILKSAKKDSDSTMEKSNKSNSKLDNIENKMVDPLEDESEENDKISYEGMVNLLNIIATVGEDTETHDEIPDINILESDLLLADENQELVNTEILEEDLIDLITSNEQKDNIINTDHLDDLMAKANLNESNTVGPITVEKEEVKSELQIQNISSNESLKFETNKLEEDLVDVEESNIIHMEQTVSQEDTNQLDTDGQSSKAKSEPEYELSKLLESEEDIEVDNQSFTPFIKDGVGFSSEDGPKVEIPEAEPKEVVKQIIDQVKFDLSESKNEMKLSLKPEALGDMTMSIEVVKGEITAKIMVDNYITKEIVEGNIVQLKEGIEDTGMEIKTFEVFVGNGSDFDNHSSRQFNLRHNSKKLKIRTENKRSISEYEDGTIESTLDSSQYNLEGGLNLLA